MQEITTNTVRHAEAATCGFSWTRPDGIGFEARDDGRGADAWRAATA